MMASCLTLQSSLLTLQSKTLTGKKARLSLQYSPQKTYTTGKENIEENPKSKYGLQLSKLFSGKEIVLELSAKCSAKDKRELKNKIIENGGKVSFVVSKRTELLVCESENLATRKFNLALQYGIPVVAVNYLHDSLKHHKLLPFDKYLVTNKITSSAFDSGKVKLLEPKLVAKKRNRITAVATPYVPCSSLENYHLLKAVQLANLTSLKPQHHGKKDAVTIHFYICELHCQTNRINDDASKYCVFTHEGILSNGSFEKVNTTMLCRFLETVDDAVAVYAQLHDQMSGLPHQMKHNDTLIHPDIGSPAFQHMQLERFEMLSSLEPAVSQLVGSLWLEAVGHISEFLATKPSGIRPWTVVEAEGILLQVLSVLGKCTDQLLHKLSKEFYTILPHLPQREIPLLEKRIVVQKLDLCQVLKDMIAVSEATGWAPRGDLEAKYRALHCRVQFVLESSMEFEKISSMVIGSQTQPNGVNVKRIFEIQRSIEHAVFTHEINNQQMLFHCTMPSNVVGILSHGLLPPRVAVTKRGVERSDMGMLGSGIYFTDSISHAIKYSKPSKSGSRFLLVSMVALGDVYQVYEINPDLDAPPENYNSVQGVQSTKERPSDFPGNEFVIYSSRQQKLCYLVEFNLPEDGEGQSVEEDAGIQDCDVKKPSIPCITYSYDLGDFFQEEPKELSSGLKVVSRDGSASWGTELALEAVHVRAQILDTVARVVLFQVYRNPFPDDVEVKFVFPLEFGAAICGFEAFIGGKHIRGEVKEKETAHREYKQAISEGHGAYLLDEDRPDVFTVHVGNLPSNTTSVIKISYITELPVERDDVRFTLPSSVAPWQKVTGMQSSANIANTIGEFTIQASLEMASDIISIHSPSHKIRVKKTETKAVVELESGGEWGGVFILYARLRDAHVPRMWVERHPEKDSEACMLTFYPEFEVKPTNDTEIVLMLDASNSMMGNAFQDAIRVCLLLLNELSSESEKCFHFNLVAFGSFFKELFPRSKPFTRTTLAQAEAFLKQVSPNMGNTDLHQLLRTYNLLTSSQVNVFVVSDGYIREEGLVASLSAQNFQIRVFTFATSQTANKHLMRTISNHTGGAFETFDASETGIWKGKVKRQVERAQQPALSNISVDWQQFKDVNEIAQAPRKITSLFSGDCLVVYGFVSNSTMATLKASLQQHEFSTMVSTSELSKTEGSLIHSLVARGIVRDWEDGPLDDDLAVHWLKKRNSRSLVVELAKQHSLVTSLTSFLAVEKRHENEVISDVPHILELLVQESVDVLPYMEYEDFHTQEEKMMEQEDEESESDQEDEESESDQEDEESESDMGFAMFSDNAFQALQEEASEFQALEEEVQEAASEFQALEEEGDEAVERYLSRKYEEGADSNKDLKLGGGGRLRHRKYLCSSDRGGGGRLRHRKYLCSRDEDIHDLEMEDETEEYKTMERDRGTSRKAYRSSAFLEKDTGESRYSTHQQQKKQKQSFHEVIDLGLRSEEIVCESALHVPEELMERPHRKVMYAKMPPFLSEIWDIDDIPLPPSQSQKKQAFPETGDAFQVIQRKKKVLKSFSQHATPFEPSEDQQPLSGVSSSVQQPGTLFGAPTPVQQSAATLFGAPTPVQQPSATMFGTSPIYQPQSCIQLLSHVQQPSTTPSGTPILDTLLRQPVQPFGLSQVQQPTTVFRAPSQVQHPLTKFGAQQKQALTLAKPARASDFSEASIVADDFILDYSMSVPQSGRLTAMFCRTPAMAPSILEDTSKPQEEMRALQFEYSASKPELSETSQGQFPLSTPFAFSASARHSCGPQPPPAAFRASAPSSRAPPPRPSYDRKLSMPPGYFHVAFGASETCSHSPPSVPSSDNRVQEKSTREKKRLPADKVGIQLRPISKHGDEVGIQLQPITKQSAEAFVDNIISWKGGGLPICSALYAEVKSILQKRGTPLSDISNPDSSTNVEEMFDKQEAIVNLLEKHGLHSLGAAISEQVIRFVIKLAGLYLFLLKVVFPKVLQSEDSNDCDAVIREASSILVENAILVKTLMEVNKTNRKYPLIYSNLELGKSWEDFLMSKVFLLP